MNHSPREISPTRPSRLVSKILAVFFHHLYHSLAPFYDGVAWLVSAGNWVRWVQSILVYQAGNDVLEIGYGPGHLQVALLEKGVPAYGIDESPHMARLAASRLSRRFGRQTNLVRGLGQALPYPTHAFDWIVATFPAPYIFSQETIVEIHRTLREGARITILLAALPNRRNLINRVVHWLLRITGEAPSPQANFTELSQRFSNGGLTVNVAWVTTPDGKLLIVDGRKRNCPEGERRF